MASFVNATAVTRDGEFYRAAIDPEWFIWGPFGGYIAALAMRAMGAATTKRRPATFSCQYLRVGAEGPVEIEVEQRKSGRRAECLRASIIQAGAVLLEAQSWMIDDDLNGLKHTHTRMPEVRPPAALLPWNGMWNGIENDEERSPLWAHIDRKLTKRFGTADFDPSQARWSCWVRLTQPLPKDDIVQQAARAILWMDMAPWNAALVRHGWPTTHIAPTLDLTVQFQPAFYGPWGASDWLLVETESAQAAAGLFGAQSTLWSETGELIGAAQALCVTNERYDEQKTRA
jgi:acyl-CoA thioesterase